MDIIDKVLGIMITWFIIELVLFAIFRSDERVFSVEFLRFWCIIVSLNQINKSIQGKKHGSNSN